MNEPILDMREITKTFPGVIALDRVSFSCLPGEVHALMGQNGAGKSTLVKILAGAMQPDSGEILIKGQPVQIRGPRMAQELGIGIIYQEFNLLPNLSVAENIFLGRPPRNRLGLINWPKLRRDAQAVLDRLGVAIDVEQPLYRIAVAEQQMVEIAKALSRQSEILIMDEPSAVLGGQDLARLFDVIRNLKGQGVTVIYISHRLAEVYEIADRVTVLRDGQLENVVDPRQTREGDLVRMMIGRQLREAFPEPTGEKGPVVLEVAGLSQRNEFENVSFQLRSGEVLGLAGMVGSGRTALARAIFGSEPPDAGTIRIDGQEVQIRNPSAGLGHGLALVPEDRKADGLVLGLSVRKNITLPILNRLARYGVMDDQAERRIVDENVRSLEIRTPSIRQEVRYLSGGNQQKVVLAKWLTAEPKVIILDEPTRGIDVGTKVEMYELIRRLADRGAAIILISSELPEIQGLSDRILVMFRGLVVGELARAEASEEKILTLATGGRLAGPELENLEGTA